MNQSPVKKNKKVAFLGFSRETNGAKLQDKARREKNGRESAGELKLLMNKNEKLTSSHASFKNRTTHSNTYLSLAKSAKLNTRKEKSHKSPGRPTTQRMESELSVKDDIARGKISKSCLSWKSVPRNTDKDNLKKSQSPSMLFKSDLHDKRPKSKTKNELSPDKDKNVLYKSDIINLGVPITSSTIDDNVQAKKGNLSSSRESPKKNIPVVASPKKKVKLVCKKAQMPLITRESKQRKDLTSVRLSLCPKNDETTNLKSTAEQRGGKSSPNLTKGRVPSVARIQTNGNEAELGKRRSNSANTKINDGPLTELSIPQNSIEYIKMHESALPNVEHSTVNVNKCGFIEAIVTNTHTGLVRGVNEDRVSVTLNTPRRHSGIKKSGIAAEGSIFSVFDGHGGTQCCNFLKANLHNFLSEKIDMGGSLVSSIRKVYKELDDRFLKLALEKKYHYAGSSANTLMVIGRSLVVINTGDSRAILSLNKGRRVVEASIDHKPDKISEFHRITSKGGEIYKMAYKERAGQHNFYYVDNYAQLKKLRETQRSAKNLNFGPWRVSPGGLSLSRSFGDIEAKIPQLGGNPKVVTAKPDVTEFDVENVDFAIIASKLNSGWNI